jgi:hypothetical protein
MGTDEFEVSFDDGPAYDDTNDQHTDEKKFDKDLYKKWFRSKERQGFLSIRPWLSVGKLVVDIGQADPNTKKLSSHTNVYVNAITLATFLKAVTEGYAEKLYPKNDKGMVQTAEGLTLFGGSRVEGKPVARVFKIAYYPRAGQDAGFDDRSFQWKTGHFEANESASGAFMPIMAKPISVDSIKVSRVEMAEISYVVNLGLSAHAAQNPDWYNN